MQLLDVDVHLGRRRREVGGVVHQLGQHVHHALGRVAGHGRAARRVQPHPLVAVDPPERPAQNALHRDRPAPPPATAGTGQHGDAVGHPAGLRGAVVEPEQVAEHLLAVPVLHLAQFRVHAGGQCLDPAGRRRTDRQGRGALALAVPDLLGEQREQAFVRGVPMGHQDGLHRSPGAQSAHHLRDALLGQPRELLPLVVGRGPDGSRLAARLDGLGTSGEHLGPGRLRLALRRRGVRPGGPRLGHRHRGGRLRPQHRGQRGLALGADGGQSDRQPPGPAPLQQDRADRQAPHRRRQRGPEADRQAVPGLRTADGRDYRGAGHDHCHQGGGQRGRFTGLAGACGHGAVPRRASEAGQASAHRPPAAAGDP